jgi:hypothetical protein
LREWQIAAGGRVLEYASVTITLDARRPALLWS